MYVLISGTTQPIEMQFSLLYFGKLSVGFLILLVNVTHRWAAAIDNSREGLAVSLDMTAFDRVWHRALLAKFPLYGLPDN